MKITISKPEKNTIKETICDIAVLSAAASVSAAGFVMSICSMIQMGVVPAMVLSAAVICGVCCSAASRSGSGNYAVLVIAAAVLCIPCLVFNEWFINGTLAFINGAADALGRSSDIIISRYELISEETVLRDFNVFVIVLTVLISCGLHMFIRLRKFPVMAVLIAAALLLICSDVNNNGYAKALLAAGIICSGIYRVYSDTGSCGMRNRASMAAVCCAGVILTAGAAAGLTGAFFPADKYEQNAVLVGIREGISDQIEAVRFGGNKINTLPKGDLTEADTWEGSDDIALEVTMDEPQSLYLRGFVGSVYESNEWQETDRAVYYENRGLFYGLDEAGFAADRQLAMLRGLLTDSDLEDEKISIVVKNRNADREYMYAPYELISIDGNADSSMGESCCRSKELFGKKSYSMESCGNLAKDFPQLAAEGYIHHLTADDMTYAEAESHYNAFVYDCYTSIPDSLYELFEKELGYGGTDKEDHINYYSAIQKIRVYLESRMTYGEYVKELPEDADFVEYFIEESRIGNPVHYATTAALMFRYFGIPARYAEGYVITPDDADEASGENVIEVAGTRGHAWVEIYVDGIGWVPVEMTPEYYDLMEQPDFTKGLEATSTVVVEKPDDAETQKEDDSTSDGLRNRLVKAFINVLKLLMWLIIIFDIFCILFFLYAFIHRGVVNSRRRKAFGQSDDREAVKAMVAYMGQLMSFAGEIYSTEEMEGYHASYRIGEKAAFSLHDISPQERLQVEQAKDVMLDALKTQKGWYEKWVLKYIERLY